MVVLAVLTAIPVVMARQQLLMCAVKTGVMIPAVMVGLRCQMIRNTFLWFILALLLKVTLLSVRPLLR